MLRTSVEGAASLFEAAGTFVMTIGALVALVMTVRDRDSRGVFKGFRYRLGRAIILGLELLVAADILRTISTQPTITEVAVLGGIVFIRTFLSFSLEVELDGRWPWHAREVMPDLPSDRQPHGPSPSEARH
ncbi:MAG TPA: DUF1622 domain-containing protein [Polyangia bacterium]|nr:DUF1622 domain-containing protein [Polyangia bacterium]